MVRFKNRYIVIEIHLPESSSGPFSTLPLRSTALYNAIQNKLQQLHGDYGVAAVRSGFTAKYCNEHTRVAFIRVRHGPHRLVASTLPFITSIGGHNATVKTIYTGATLLQCYKFLQCHQRQQLDIVWSQCRPEERKQMEEAFLTLKFLGNAENTNTNEVRFIKS